MAVNKKAVKITSIEKLSMDVYSMWVTDLGIVFDAMPGQFFSLYCKSENRLLPRPISICEIDKENNSIRFVYRVVGNGTKEFEHLKVGDMITVMGPLGNGFTLKESKSILIGGGIGIPPMLELAKQLRGELQIVLGYRDNNLFLAEEFLKYGQVYIATEDGSNGTKGNVIDALIVNQISGDMIYACGPTPMLKGVKSYAAAHKITTQLSLEEKMACGIGACLACVCKSKEVDPHTHVNNKRICKEGPVFFAEEIEL